MNAQSLSNIAALSYSQKTSLRKGGIRTVSDLIALSIPDIVRKCRIAHSEAQEIINIVFDDPRGPVLYSLDDIDCPRDETFTTGDSILDKAFGGGVRTRKLWEVVGESAAGKTQLAMQIALCVQLPQELGGVLGSACFISTSWTLATNRLVEIANHHTLLSPSLCGLSDIHTMKTPTIPLLLHVLSETLPAFLDALKSNSQAKPVKLLVVDAITELFHSGEEVTTSTLAERSKNLHEIATLLHTLADKYGLAVVVMNEVSDVIDRGPPPSGRPYEVSYRDQARLFNRADSIPEERQKEAALGLVWANQVNARIMLTRTNRVRALDDTEYRPSKRRRTGDDPIAVQTAASSDAEPIRVRRLSVIFNSLASPISLDYIITQGGVVVLEGSEETPSSEPRVASPVRQSAGSASPVPLDEVCPLDLLFAAGDSEGPSSDLPSSLPSSGADLRGLADPEGPEILSEGLDAENGPQDGNDDEWEEYWKNTDFGDDVYSQIDLDALSPDKPQ